ncbi:MAG: phage holin family protein [Robiginitalea sp.]|nr:phage holin family protein [Robiginitalea sp.]
MAAPVLQEPLLKAVGEVQNYVESSTDYLRLQMFRTLMRLLTSLAKSVALGVLAFLSLLFLSVAAALALGRWLQDDLLAFVYVGVFYILAAVVAYLLRHRIERRILRSFSDLYYD